MEKAFNKLLKIEGQRDVFGRFTILMNQIGDLSKVIEYACGVYKLNLKTDSAYRAELKIALVDPLTQPVLLARMFGFNYEELLKLGTSRLFEWTLKRYAH
jgi:hypothetical protein